MRFSQRAVSVASSASDIEDMIINDDALEFDRYNNWSIHASNSSDFSNLTRWDLDTPDLLVPYVNYLQLRRTRSFAPPFDLESYIIRRELRRTRSSASSPDLVSYASRLEIRRTSTTTTGPLPTTPTGTVAGENAIEAGTPLARSAAAHAAASRYTSVRTAAEPFVDHSHEDSDFWCNTWPRQIPGHMGISHTADLGDLAEVDPGMPSPFTPRRPPLVRSQRYSPFEPNWGPAGSVNDTARPWL
jgi:hypothetical protein